MHGQLLSGFTAGPHYWTIVDKRRQGLFGGARDQGLWWLDLGMAQSSCSSFCVLFSAVNYSVTPSLL